MMIDPRREPSGTNGHESNGVLVALLCHPYCDALKSKISRGPVPLEKLGCRVPHRKQMRCGQPARSIVVISKKATADEKFDRRTGGAITTLSHDLPAGPVPMP